MLDEGILNDVGLLAGDERRVTVELSGDVETQ
jgi:hypothetical protein